MNFPGHSALLGSAQYISPACVSLSNQHLHCTNSLLHVFAFNVTLHLTFLYAAPNPDSELSIYTTFSARQGTHTSTHAKARTRMQSKQPCAASFRFVSHSTASASPGTLQLTRATSGTNLQKHRPLRRPMLSIA